jgi:hypothetical protein
MKEKHYALYFKIEHGNYREIVYFNDRGIMLKDFESILPWEYTSMGSIVHDVHEDTK